MFSENAQNLARSANHPLSHTTHVWWGGLNDHMHPLSDRNCFTAFLSALEGICKLLPMKLVLVSEQICFTEPWITRNLLRALRQLGVSRNPISSIYFASYYPTASRSYTVAQSVKRRPWWCVCDDVFESSGLEVMPLGMMRGLFLQNLNLHWPDDLQTSPAHFHLWRDLVFKVY